MGQMKIDELSKWAVPSAIIKRWKERQGTKLLPIQSRAIKKGLLGRSHTDNESKDFNMLISAPTSSGKSFCAELAAVGQLANRRKTVMLFPLKSLAEQKYRLFEKTYGPLGISCLIVTADHPENNRRFREGDYQLAVCIYEKFDALLTGRGALLERLLTKIKASAYNPRVLALSAVIGDERGSAGKLADWMEATLVEESLRPVELKCGIAAAGKFRYRLYNDGAEGIEPFAFAVADESSFGLPLDQLQKENGTTLVFLKSRKETIEAAYKLSALVDWPEAKEAIGQLEGEESSYLIRILRQVMSRGVAFHNADLSSRQRDIVEHAFVGKQVRVVFSTTTLAMGVNLSADNIYLETVKYSQGKYGRRPSLVPVSRSEFDNMAGRAGRYSHIPSSSVLGKVTIMAASEFEQEILWDNYIAPDRVEPLESAFDSAVFEDWLLNMISCGLLTQAEPSAFEKLMNQTFYATTSQGRRPEFMPAINYLQQSGLIKVDDYSRLTPTTLGEVVATVGLSAGEAVAYRNKLEQSWPENDFGWLALALSVESWALPTGILSCYEQRNNIPLQLYHQYCEDRLPELSLLLGEDYRRYLREPLNFRQSGAIKAIILLEQWRQLEPIQKLEEQFQMHLGQIISLGENAAYLVSAVKSIIGALDRSHPAASILTDLSFELKYGLPAEYKNIHQHFKKIFSRSDFRALAQAGIKTVEELCRLDEKDCCLMFSGKAKLLKINEKIEILKEEVEMDVSMERVCGKDVNLCGSIASEPEVIEIDGTYERERYLVKINGYPVRLTGKSFKYFTKLAWSRINGESGWIYKDDIEIGFNQARYLYRMKGEINHGLSGDWSMIENNRLGYYRLNADPNKIRMNLDNLKNHPDFEIRALVGSPEAAN